MIRHPGASAVVPFLDDPGGIDPQVLLIRQYRYATDGEIYEIPAGRLNPGEDPRTCAKRELTEETGYSAEGLQLLTTFYTTPGFTDEKIHIFMASAVDPGESALEADEVVTLVPMAFSAALGMIKSGDITDAKTIIGLLFAAQFVRSR
jgi:ADP-ribose pyrophosphatase